MPTQSKSTRRAGSRSRSVKGRSTTKRASKPTAKSASRSRSGGASTGITSYSTALRWLYEHALALVFPSLAEGFGLPIVEAMAAGCPVLTSRCSAMPEVAGGAALEVDPRDVDDMARGLKRLIQEESLRESLREAGRARAAKFTWKEVAGETLVFLREVARAPH